MSWTPTIKKAFSITDLKIYINNLDFSNWKPSLIVWHNTGLPTIQQWEKSYQSDISKSINPPGSTRINNLESYFRDNQHWSAGPHFFVYKDKVWAFTPANKKGVHSPSWNGISIGIEMVGDFAIEDDESGIGLQIKNNTIALTAILCEKLGLNPEVAIKLHKEDKATTHDCPGKHIAEDKFKMVQSVLEYMGQGGEHTGDILETQAVKKFGLVRVPDFLNLREKSSASSRVLVKLLPNVKLEILNEAQNGKTKWYLVDFENIKGWVSAQYIKGLS